MLLDVDEQDIQILRELIKLAKNGLIPSLRRDFEERPVQAPDTYCVYVEQTIPALELEPGSGPHTLSSVMCTVYRKHGDTLEEMGFQMPVSNISGVDIAAEKFIGVTRDKPGMWFAVAPNGLEGITLQDFTQASSGASPVLYSTTVTSTLTLNHRFGLLRFGDNEIRPIAASPTQFQGMVTNELQHFDGAKFTKGYMWGANTVYISGSPAMASGGAGPISTVGIGDYAANSNNFTAGVGLVAIVTDIGGLFPPPPDNVARILVRNVIDLSGSGEYVFSDALAVDCGEVWLDVRGDGRCHLHGSDTSFQKRFRIRRVAGNPYTPTGDYDGATVVANGISVVGGIVVDTGMGLVTTNIFATPSAGSGAGELDTGRTTFFSLAATP